MPPPRAITRPGTRSRDPSAPPGCRGRAPRTRRTSAPRPRSSVRALGEYRPMALDQATYPRQGGRMHPVPGMPPSPDLTTAIVREPGGVRLMLRGELDMSGGPETESAVRAAAELTDGRLVIDLTELAFMDVFGARTLLRVADEALSADREVVIANPNRHIRRLFELITDLARGGSLVAELVRPAG